MVIYGLRKDNGFVVYDAETKKIIKRYTPESFPQEILRYFKSVNLKIERTSGLSNDDKKKLEEIIKIDSIKI